jgi:drug/metabolite transporter (DMT)-like permease
MPRLAKETLGLVLAVASPVFFCAFDVGLRIISADVTIYGLLLIRGLVGTAMALAVARAMRVTMIFGDLKTLVTAGLAAAMASVCTTTSITMIPLYQAVVILYAYPAFSVILARIILGDRITLTALAGVLTAFAGCALLVWPDHAAGLEPGWFHALGVLGALLYALCYVVVRGLGDRQSGLEPFLFFSLAAILVAWPLSRLFGAGLGVDSVSEAARAAVLALLGSAAKIMGFAALRFLPPFRVGVIGTLEVMGGALCSWLIFSDPMTVRALIGAVVVVYAAFGFRSRRPRPGGAARA